MRREVNFVFFIDQGDHSSDFREVVDDVIFFVGVECDLEGGFEVVVPRDRLVAQQDKGVERVLPQGHLQSALNLKVALGPHRLLGCLARHQVERGKVTDGEETCKGGRRKHGMEAMLQVDAVAALYATLEAPVRFDLEDCSWCGDDLGVSPHHERGSTNHDEGASGKRQVARYLHRVRTVPVDFSTVGVSTAAVYHDHVRVLAERAEADYHLVPRNNQGGCWVPGPARGVRMAKRRV
mmetsp:Transcript_14042/g.39787  ORF Transcript_14042/g.39787 Transcript_14042/m.39787 type:complete len:237 (-) Transcript_14042:439-1149(-)